MMERSIKFKATLLLLLFLVIGLTGCEKDDFIPEPTATSVTITGVVTTSYGKPIANLPVSIDYHEAYNFMNQTLIHKAKGVTDSNGRYRLFFEPEPDKSDLNEKPLQVYLLRADLGGLPSADYILPSDLREDNKTTYSYSVYKIFQEKENIEINLFFPRKKELSTELKNFVADKRLQFRNTIRYGAYKESIDRPLILDAEGNGNALIPYAVDETNEISIYAANSLWEVCDSREVSVTAQTDTPIVFDNKAVLDNCRFKLSRYSNFAFNGKDYPDEEDYKVPAPFDFLGFRIVSPDGEYEFPSSRYQYYDSIVWNSPDFPETYRIYDNRYFENGTSEHLTSQWGSYFFLPGSYTTVLSGYKNGKAIYSDSLSFELKDRDFLCFDWDKFDFLTEQGTAQKVYCRLDSQNEYQVSAEKSADGVKSVDIQLHINGGWNQQTLLNWQMHRLQNLMWKHLGHWVEYDKSTIGELFRMLPTDHTPGLLYENETTRAIVMHSPATEYEKEFYYIHAEPKWL